MRSLTVLIAILTPLAVLMIVGIRPFLAHWIDPNFALLAGPVGAVISISVFVNGFSYVPYAFLDARGRPDLTAKFHMIEILPHAALLWFCLQWFGLIGGAWAVVFLSAFDATLLFWKSDLRIYTMWTFWQALLWVTFAVVVAPMYVERHLFFYFLASAAVLGSIGWGLRISPDVYAFIATGLRRLYRWQLSAKSDQSLHI